MKSDSPLFRYAIGVRDQIHEWAATRAEQQILSFVVQKLARQGASARSRTVVDTKAWALDTLQRNQTRIAELEGRRINKIALACRSAMLRMPNPTRDRLRAAVRSTFGRLGSRAAAKSADGNRARRACGPLDDSALAVPFGRAFPGPKLDHAVGVIVHVYYPDLAEEMRDYLENIPGSVDVYISTDTDAKRDDIQRVFSGWTKGRSEVRLAPNRGRDVAPKLITFKDVYDRHPFVLHLHSKKSPHDSSLKMWRFYTCENLIGDEAIASSILGLLERSPDIGMVAPQHYFGVKNLIGWAGNLAIAQPLGRRMGVEIDPASPLDFPSGSMFWARSAALKPLLDLNLSFDDFAPEGGQADGTLAHAIERLYFYSCELAGLKWVKVCRPELAHERECTLVRVSSEGELIAFMKEFARPLEASK